MVFSGQKVRDQIYMKYKLINSAMLCLLTGPWMIASSSDSLDDIQFWAGRGSNRAALVIDWYDGDNSRSLMWGYQWNGTATGLDLLQAIVASDSRLFTHLGQFSWGTAILGIGYNNSPETAFEVTPSLSFDNSGIAMFEGADSADDNRISTNPDDYYLEGWNSGFWALYANDSPNENWVSSMTGAGGQILKNGSLYGLRFAPGFTSDAPSEPIPAAANPFGFIITASEGPFGAAPNDDPLSLLGKPATDFYDPFLGLSGGSNNRRVKLVEAPFNLDISETQKLITTFNEGSSAIVKFEQPIFDAPGNPYGIDLLVFGNAFYSTSGTVNEDSNMDSIELAGGVFSEPTKISVSPGFTGAEGQSEEDPTTWEWYRFDNGPFADTGFPTQAYQWNSEDSSWSDELMDFTKPVNPAFDSLLQEGGMSVADAIDLYDGAGGGTGFDIALSGFESIQYVCVEGLDGFSGGEVDAISAVRPSVLGDSLSIAPANLSNGANILQFQHPTKPGRNAIKLNFSNLSDPVRVSTMELSESDVLTSDTGEIHVSTNIRVVPMPGVDNPTFIADLELGVARDYDGDGADLAILQRTDDKWEYLSTHYNSSTRSVTLSSVTSLSDIALTQIKPKLSIETETNESGESLMNIRFGTIPGFTYSVLRSNSVNFSDAEEIGNVSVVEVQQFELSDDIILDGAFYHVRANRTVTEE